jgi:hypothetical protein
LDQGTNKVQISSDLEISKTSSYHIFAELKAWANMKYIDEVCAVLTDEVERRYLCSRDAWQLLSDEVSAADEATPEQIQKAEQAHKDYIRASKEYLGYSVYEAVLRALNMPILI